MESRKDKKRKENLELIKLAIAVAKLIKTVLEILF